MRLPQARQRNLANQSLLLLLLQASRHVGFDKTRCHTIDRDVARAQFPRQRARHTRNARLGSRVVGLTRVAAGTYHRGDIDDATVALLHHRSHHATAQAKHCFQISIKHGVPLVVFHAQGQVVARDAGVVDQNMQAAVLFDNGVNERLRGQRIVDVQPHARAARKRCQRLRNVGCTGVAGRRASHFQPTLGQRQRNRRANTARGPGDQGDLPGKFNLTHAPLPKVRS